MVVRIAIGHVSADPALTGIMPILIDRIFASSATFGVAKACLMPANER